MVKRPARASIWKLLLGRRTVLPYLLPLAALVVTAAGLAGRGWQVGHTPPPAGAATQLSTHTDQSGEDGYSESRPDTIPAPAGPADSASGVALSPDVRAPQVSPARSQPQRSEAAKTSSHIRYSFEPERKPSTDSYGPAPEPVAPSHEAALRPSEPPPAVASAPRPAPAPIAPAVPAPEPRTPPQAAPMQPIGTRSKARGTHQVRAVRFDAGYYYGGGLSARELAEELARSWADQGVNLVYYYAYNRVYGARYHTRYAGNIMEDYGRQDLLRHVLRECHKHGIKVIAWVQGVQHKQLWESHPEWRQKKADGSDYKPDADSYYLCVRNPEVMQWWLGLVDELLQSYPDLDGVDLAEFQLDLWGDHACYCEHCREQFAQAHPKSKAPSDEWREFRAEGLSRVLLATTRLAHSYGKEVHVTTVLTARPDGKLMTSAQVRDAIGFDLEAVLAGPDRPEVIQAELIWQQWASTYGNRQTFTPQWTESAVRQAKQMVRGRAKLIAHVEVTDFGVGGLDGPGLARTIASAAQADPYGIDIYDAHLLAQTEGAAHYLQLAWLGASE